MAFRRYKCSVCGQERVTKLVGWEHCEALAELCMDVPSTKFTECVDPETQVSKLVNQTQILKARAKAHIRDQELDDLIQEYPSRAAVSGWITATGKKRTSIDEK